MKARSRVDLQGTELPVRIKTRPLCAFLIALIALIALRDLHQEHQFSE